ncbi:MAG: hypothetical protein MZV63_57080 [Marinilabiliales bacterium]|nr:hypothetical protein [Marinilabiliales bacterium]
MTGRESISGNGGRISKNPGDIWNEIVKVTNIPGLTSAPKLQPIETRLVMLSTGMRAPMGLKVYGPDLNAIEAGRNDVRKGVEGGSVCQTVCGLL